MVRSLFVVSGVADQFLQYLLGESEPILIDGEAFDEDKQTIMGVGSDEPEPPQRSSSTEDKKSPEQMV